MTSMTRTIRLAIGTAAMLALMSSAAQARPLTFTSSSAPTTPVGALSPDRAETGTWHSRLPRRSACLARVRAAAAAGVADPVVGERLSPYALPGRCGRAGRARLSRRPTEPCRH